MKIFTLKLKTETENQLIDITSDIQAKISSNKFKNGIVKIFIPHTTAAVTINENADPDVKKDIIHGMNRISPNLKEFCHFENNSDAHIKSSLFGTGEEILVSEGKMVLGTWQAIYFCEFDGPRNRKAIISLIEV